MEIKQAIEIFNILIEVCNNDFLPPSSAKNLHREAFEMAIAALERQEQPCCERKTEPCQRCNDNSPIWTYKDDDHEFMRYRADRCPHCGRNLTNCKQKEGQLC